jgi:hypothetical protein
MADITRTPTSTPGPAHRRLDIFLGKWINERQTVAGGDAPEHTILTSDVYEWMPGGFFILHTAYGRIGEISVGGTEIIGYDEASGTYRCHFFASQGTLSVHALTVQGARGSGPVRPHAVGQSSPIKAAYRRHTMNGWTRVGGGCPQWTSH